MLVNVYSYRVMEKVCLAVVCVEGGLSQIQSQILFANNDYQCVLTAHAFSMIANKKS